MSGRVIVTRPRADAVQWVDGLGDRGLEAVALPLIEIAPTRHTQALEQARSALPHCAAAMFVSGNAVTFFLESNRLLSPASRAWEAIKTRAWATGPATASALRAAGVDAALIDAPGADAGQWDSEALWALVRGQVGPGDRVLVVRGSDASGQAAGRDWLSDRLRAAGARVDTVLAYERRLPCWEVAEQALARQAALDGSCWLFSSSESVHNLRQLMPAQDWHRARAVATHPRIAMAVREAGFGVVCESRPSLADVWASIESLQ